MKQVNIFVEGKSDIKFIQDYLGFIKYNVELFNFIQVGGGVENLHMRVNEFHRNTVEGGINLIIFDSDDNFESKKADLLSFRSKYFLRFEFFLLPNNSDSGNLETLLENIINPENQVLIRCFNKYHDCIDKEGRFQVPTSKSKIYAYLEALLPKSKSKELQYEFRDYKNQDYWNLNSDYLQPLKSFIESYVKK